MPRARSRRQRRCLAGPNDYTAHEAPRQQSSQQSCVERQLQNSDNMKSTDQLSIDSTALLSGIVSTATDAIISIDDQQRITLFNHGAQRTFGYTEDEALGQPLNMLLPKTYHEIHNRHIDDFGSQGENARRMGERTEIFGLRKNGEIFFAEASISALMIGGRRAYTAVLRDVTERRTAEKQLQESKAVLEIALETGRIGIFEHDHACGAVTWSPLMRSICGLPGNAPITAETYPSLVPEDERSKVLDALVRTNTGDDTAVEHRIRRPDGETRWMVMRARRLLSDGRPARIVGAVQDITDRKNTEATLRERVEASTRELRMEMKRREESQAQLVRTQRMEAYGQLTGGIAHDFNNLLTVISGNLELLEMRITEEKQRVHLNRAIDAAEMGARLTARLLTFARRRSFSVAPVNVNELVIGLAELFERTLGEQISLTTLLASRPWTVMVDPSELENAILNLAINARDAMPNGGRLVIETANLSLDVPLDEGVASLPKGNYVRISVTDTGVGMTTETLNKAFEPFFTTKAPGKGTGLGLSSIYGFAQQARGAVTMSSKIGIGTTVRIYLPQSDERSAIDAAPADAGMLTALSGRVLLVEDNAEVRATTRNLLESLGYEVKDVDSGPAAVATLQRDTTFDIVLSDVVMPGGMSGFDLARWIATNVTSARVLLASGFPDDAKRNVEEEAIGIDILAKPYSRRDLGAALQKLIAASANRPA